MKYKDIVTLKVEELRKRLEQLNQELFDSKMKLSMQRLSNPLLIRTLRKDKARLQTAINHQNNKTSS